jgi:hypothetical protein
MGLQQLEKRATTFWEWFSNHEAELRSLKPSTPQWHELDRRISTLGVNSWEIGPSVASAAQHALALSPQGDPGVYKTTQRIIALAPKLKAWEFLPAKPRKAWKRRFLWSSKQISIDASNWKFLLYRYEDGKVEVVLVGHALDQFETGERRRIAEFVVESELGEATCIERLCGVDVEPEPARDLTPNTVSIAELFSAFVGRTAA